MPLPENTIHTPVSAGRGGVNLGCLICFIAISVKWVWKCCLSVQDGGWGLGQLVSSSMLTLTELNGGWDGSMWRLPDRSVFAWWMLPLPVMVAVPSRFAPGSVVPPSWNLVPVIISY